MSGEYILKCLVTFPLKIMFGIFTAEVFRLWEDSMVTFVLSSCLQMILNFKLQNFVILSNLPLLNVVTPTFSTSSGSSQLLEEGGKVPSCCPQDVSHCTELENVNVCLWRQSSAGDTRFKYVWMSSPPSAGVSVCPLHTVSVLTKMASRCRCDQGEKSKHNRDSVETHGGKNWIWSSAAQLLCWCWGTTALCLRLFVSSALQWSRVWACFCKTDHGSGLVSQSSPEFKDLSVWSFGVCLGSQSSQDDDEMFWT